jgi:hypothetical protein
MSPGFLDPNELLWKPLFEAAAQTIVGAIGAYSFGKVLSRVYESNRYDGGMDIWLRACAKINSEMFWEGGCNSTRANTGA